MTGSASEGSHRSPEDDVASKDLLERAFERLDPPKRALLVLHHLESRPVDEIADVLGVSPGTVKSQLWSARKALVTAIAQEETP